MSHLSETDILQLKGQLDQQKNIISQQLKNSDNFGLGRSLKETTGELSVYDNHPADIGSEVFERGKDLALNENAEKRLSSINIALDKIKDGHYGTCVTCGEQIPYERLEAIPSTEYCIKHSPKRSVSQHRPIEEPIIRPPFGRRSMDESDEENHFEKDAGPDAWETVESWGTSSSTALTEDAQFEDNDEVFNDDAYEGKGFIDPFESFITTDIYGRDVSIVKNHQYEKYVKSQEDEGMLEIDSTENG